MPSDSSTDVSVIARERFTSTTELQEWFRDLPESARLLPTGRGTKLLDKAGGDIDLRLADVSGLQGITAYDPSEFLITAAAGTPMRDIVQSLAVNGQYLPCDPCLLAEGATLGGTLAAGISGPSRLLYGSLRDFVMEVEFLDGLGNLVRGGGKVVKNAAGFDFPKLMVGSLGRLGVITEATLKVFPRPDVTATVCVSADSVQEAVRVAQALQAQPVPLNAITIDCVQSRSVYVQFASPKASLDATAQRIEAIIDKTISGLAKRRLTGDDERACHHELVNQTLTFPQRQVTRTCQTPSKVGNLDAALVLLGLRRQYWSAGEVCWIDTPNERQDALGDALLQLGISGMTLPLTPDDSYRLGDTSWLAGAKRMKSALDPDDKFLAY